VKNQLFCNNKSNTYRNRKIKTDSLYCRCVGKGVEENEGPKQHDNESLGIDLYSSCIVCHFQPMWKHKRHCVLKTKSVKISVSRTQTTPSMAARDLFLAWRI